MGSWWQVMVGKQPIPVWGKNRVPDQLMLVFTADDMFTVPEEYAHHDAFESGPACDAAPASNDRDDHSRKFGYQASVGSLRRRLDLQGFGAARVRALAEALVESEMFGEPDPDYPLDDPRDGWPEGRATYPDAGSVVTALASVKGRKAAAALEPSPGEQAFLSDRWQDVRESFDDPRFALALSLISAQPNTLVTLDLTDLLLGGWVEITDRLDVDARTRMTQSIAASGPVIVITEGSTDARWMRRAIEIAAPEVAHVFEFLDFAGYKAPGGTDRVVSLTKGMAAAGVMNRIVAVLDNDTVGASAAKQLVAQRLPDGVSVITLPDVPYGRRYPTLGPGGGATADINGSAAAIEFMFGEDVLRDSSSGALFPIRWQTYVPAQGKYQGALEGPDKKVVEQRLDTVLDVRRADLLTPQVYAGCRRLADVVVAAARPPQLLPATDMSELAAGWLNSLKL